jgi:transcription initiation factor TFIIA large subunit
MAASALQGQINQALQSIGVDVKASTTSVKNKGFVQVDGQTAGGDSSEDEDEDDDDDDDLDDDADDRDDEREEEPEEEGQDEEPLNSDDDVSDAEGSSERLYDIENVVVCQFDKITRTRNKWKFHLKDGIMNLNGKDYVFQKATGDAEW